MDLQTILADWRQNAPRHYHRNSRFLHSLKSLSENRVDQAARELHEEAFSLIDCTRCANCCRTSHPAFEQHEIERIARRLGVEPAELVEKHFVPCEDEPGMQPKDQPCPLLAANGRCTVYEDRPASCAGFPYTDEPGFASRTYMHASNTLGCPAVFYIVERMRTRGV
jgi:Fe-S-cluster containining protein